MELNIQNIGVLIAAISGVFVIFNYIRKGIYYLDNKELVLALDLIGKGESVINAENKKYISDMVNYYVSRLITGVYDKEKRTYLLRLINRNAGYDLVSKLKNKKIKLVELGGVVKIHIDWKYKFFRFIFLGFALLCGATMCYTLYLIVTNLINGIEFNKFIFLNVMLFLLEIIGLFSLKAYPSIRTIINLNSELENIQRNVKIDNIEPPTVSTC